jgi:hypothetical protein
MTGAPDYQRRVEHLEELGVVRHQLGRLLAPIGDDDLSFNAVIAADELLANCFVHTDDGCSIAVWLDHNSPPRLRVEVRDTSDDQPVMHTTGASRGLRIVDRVTTHWGVNARRQGKVVWFEIALSSSVDGRDDNRGV